MRQKLVTILLGIIIIGAIGFSILSFGLLDNTSAKTVNDSSQTVVSTEPNSPNVNNNPTNPNDIPDRTAYTLLFRFLSNPLRSQDANVRSRTHSYLRQVGLGRRTGNTCAATDEADVNALVAVATEFERRVGVLDERAARLKRQNRINPNPAITAQLAQLQQQKEAIVDEIIGSLSRRLSNHALEELRRFVQERVKRNTRLR